MWVFLALLYAAFLLIVGLVRLTLWIGKWMLALLLFVYALLVKGARERVARRRERAVFLDRREAAALHATPIVRNVSPPLSESELLRREGGL